MISMIEATTSIHNNKAFLRRFTNLSYIVLGILKMTSSYVNAFTARE